MSETLDISRRLTDDEMRTIFLSPMVTTTETYEAIALRFEVTRARREEDSLRLALAEATRERDNWTETARTYAKGEDYYRGLIDAALKDDPAAYVADDGSISEDVLRAKLPEMYALAVTERKRAEAEFDRLRQDRYDALNAQTTEGLSAAEWQLRTGKAERERDEARRTVKALTPAANYCLEYKPLLLKAERERDDAVRVLRDIATFGWYAKGAKVARAYLAAREGR